MRRLFATWAAAVADPYVPAGVLADLTAQIGESALLRQAMGELFVSVVALLPEDDVWRTPGHAWWPEYVDNEVHIGVLLLPVPDDAATEVVEWALHAEEGQGAQLPGTATVWVAAMKVLLARFRHHEDFSDARELMIDQANHAAGVAGLPRP